MNYNIDDYIILKIIHIYLDKKLYIKTLSIILIYIKYSMGRTRSYTIYEKSDLDKSKVRKYNITNN